MEKEFFIRKILKWYKENLRDLPWRTTRDPYLIWLSEILLQQTRVSQGLPYYNKFIETFPDIHALAQAKEKEVLRLWEGLGYYSRARNLHASAKKLVDENKGQLPGTYKDLLTVKGIGKYTAAAIASFCYNEKVAVVDGNVYRLLSRAFGISEDIGSPQGQKVFAAMAASLLPEKQTDTYNQAVMEFGALHCTPRKPSCSSCPLEEVCYARRYGKQQDLPVKNKKISKKSRYMNYLVFSAGNKLWMKERKQNDIWKGLYEFYLVESGELAPSSELLSTGKDLRGIKIENIVESKIYRHILTHQNLFVKFHFIKIKPAGSNSEKLKKLDLKPYSRKSAEALPKPVLINKFLQDYFFS